MAPSTGTISFRSSKFVDVSIGVDGEDPSSSRVTGDRGILISNDGERRAEHLLNIGHKKRRVRLHPNALNDSLAQWIPVDDDGAEPTADMDSVSGLDVENPRKRKSYASSDDPMSLFPQVQQLFLEELLWMDGLGYSCVLQVCALCDKTVGDAAASTPGPDGSLTPERFFRCAECGPFIQCKACCVERHALMPLHTIEEWTGTFWRETTLKSLGLIYQLGHGGFPCKFPEAVKRSLTVIDSNAIHQIRYRYCNCERRANANNLVQLLRNRWYPGTSTDPDTCATFEALDSFRLLNVVGNMNAHDFIKALERKTDVTSCTGLNWLPDRYKVFLRITRQWAFLHRLKRSRRGHDPAGIKATKAGECMVICWACPYDGRNLPANWRDVDPKYRYLFRLILAMDANFKMKNRIRAREHDDPSLGPGWGAFVEPIKYKKHLSKYVAEKDISTCIAFAALTQKDTRNTAGLRCSGVGGVVCARHECMRPNGLGDLQKGERYANMDYILMSALANFDLSELTLSYDIACQWKKNFSERLAKLPPELQKEFDDILLECGLPVWHALAHEDACAVVNSLNYILGVGRTDGEGVERLWAFLNSCSYQSKEMGLGNRADTVEDKLDSYNFLKNLGLANALRRKLLVAIAERARQVAAFKEINKAISPEVRSDWQKLIDDFMADRDGFNPYYLSKNDGPSEAEIRASLTTEEKEATRKGQVPLHATSATAFLSAGLQLEETQRRIKSDITSKNLTADRESKVQEQRIAFLAKLRKFRELQAVYTPAAAQQIAKEEGDRDPDSLPPSPENIRLWLPSALSPAAREGNGCQRNVANMEATMREGQCMNALVAIRLRLHSKRFLINFRDDNITGQKKSTRSHTIIDDLGDRVELVARKYRDARTSLTALKGGDYAPHLQLLKPSDIILEGEGARDPGEAAKSDRDAQKRLARIGAGQHGRPLRSDASSKKAAGISWIWMARGAFDDSEKELHESLRVEWSRAKARKSRWEEEVDLLREEMRRVLRYLEWQVTQWENVRTDTSARLDIRPATRHGMEAYAAKQASVHHDIYTHFRQSLSLSVDMTTTSVMQAVDGEDLNALFASGSH